MKIYGIKAKNVYACSGTWALVGEAEVETESGEGVFVTMQEYDSFNVIVARNASFGFLAEGGEAPEMDIIEEYDNVKDAKGSAYWPVIDKLRKVVKMLG